MYCEKCGKETSGSSNLCNECLSRNKKTSKSKVFWLIPAVLAVVAVVMIVALIGRGNGNVEMGTKSGNASIGGFIDYVFDGEAMSAKKSSADYQAITAKKKQTFMIYLVGSDLESDYASASLDLEELNNANIDAQNSNFVIFTGGSPKWHLDIPADKNSILYLGEDGSLYRLQDREISNMGDPSTLAFFLEYSYYSFPADEYHLILWNHGGGSITGYGQDMLAEKDSLLLAEIKSALEASPFNDGNKISSVIFDACLMATIETADVFKDHAKYLIASEEVTSGFGYFYDSFAEIVENEASGAQLAEILCADAIEYLYFLSENYDAESLAVDAQKTPYSCLDLSKVEDVEKAMDDFFAALDKDIAENFSDISRARDSVYTYATYSSPQNAGIDHIDLVQFAENFLDEYPEEAQVLIDAVDELVAWMCTETDYSHGVSFYFPYYGLSAIDYKLDIYSDFDFSTGYTRFMSNFVKMLQGEEPTVWEDSEEQFGTEEEEETITETEPQTQPVTEEETTQSDDEPVSEPETEPATEPETEAEIETEAATEQSSGSSSGNVVSEIVLELNDAQVKNFLKAERCVYVKNYQGGYYLVSRTSDVELDGNTLKAEAVDYQYVISDGKNQAELSLTEYSKTKDGTFYSAPIRLTRSGARNTYDVTMDGIVAYLSILVSEEYPEGKIMGYYRSRDKNYETLYQLEEGMTFITACLGVMEKEYDEYGNLMPIYASTNTVEFNSEEVIEVNDNLEIIKKPLDGENPVYMSVIIYDTHNYSFSTSYRKIKAKKMG